MRGGEAKRRRRGGRRREKHRSIEEWKANEKINRADYGGRQIKMRNVRLEILHKVIFLWETNKKATDAN